MIGCSSCALMDHDSDTTGGVIPTGVSIDLWAVELDRVPPGGLDVLTPEEHGRAMAIRIPSARDDALGGRVWLRLVLSSYVSEDPGALRFTRLPGGKPELVEPSGHSITFNMAHSHGWACIAVTRSASIGVDLEYIQERPALEALARRYFTRNEFKCWCSLPDETKNVLFYRTWCRKEACLKALGRGIAGHLDAIDTSASVVTLDDGGRDAMLYLADVAPIPGYAGAVAVMAPVSSIHHRDALSLIVHE